MLGDFLIAFVASIAIAAGVILGIRLGRGVASGLVGLWRWLTHKTSDKGEARNNK